MSADIERAILARLGRGPATLRDLHTACPGFQAVAVNEWMAALVRDARAEIIASGDPGVSLYVMAAPPAAPRKRGRKPMADLLTPAQRQWREAIARVKKRGATE